MQTTLLHLQVVALSCSVWPSAGAKARAEQEFASARTQQEAERAEQAIKDTAAALKEVLRLKVTPVMQLQPWDVMLSHLSSSCCKWNMH